jgi:L-ascorbate metabolism protein UlaG (beta-lactamase superfamily)
VENKEMLLIRWHGHSCFEISNTTTIVTDPHDGKSIGIPTPTVSADIILISHNHYDHNSVKTVEKEGTKIITDGRKRTIENIIIKGFQSHHDKSQGEKRGENIMYKFVVDDVSFAHLGDLGHTLDEKTAECFEQIDIIFIPVGGTYTIDAVDAWNVVQKIKPKIIIPMHYKFEGLSIPISTVDEFLEKSPFQILRVGNEIDIEKNELPEEPEVWVFTL